MSFDLTTPAEVIVAARTYAAKWAEGYQEGQPSPFEREGYDEAPVFALEEMVRVACPCGCGPARLAAAEAALSLPTDYSPQDVPCSLVRYVDALATHFEEMTRVDPHVVRLPASMTSFSIRAPREHGLVVYAPGVATQPIRLSPGGEFTVRTETQVNPIPRDIEFVRSLS